MGREKKCWKIKRLEDAFFDSLKSKFDEDFIWVQDIGEGAYRKVSKCTHKFDSHDYAVKQI